MIVFLRDGISVMLAKTQLSWGWIGWIQILAIFLKNLSNYLCTFVEKSLKNLEEI